MGRPTNGCFWEAPTETRAAELGRKRVVCFRMKGKKQEHRRVFASDGHYSPGKAPRSNESLVDIKGGRARNELVHPLHTFRLTILGASECKSFTT